MVNVDWGAGEYEPTAAQLLPAAHVLVRAAHLLAGDRVLDVGCGTGSVALIAARGGAVVTGVDPSERLRNVAEVAAASEGLDVTVVSGDAASLPFPDASFDAVLSSFAAIFAPDPAAAVAEMIRVLAPGGRLILSAWLPGGTVADVNAAAVSMVLEALGAPEPPAPFSWHEQTALQELVTRADPRMTVQVEEHELAFVAASPEEYLEVSSLHPMAVAGVGVLERAGKGAAARARLLAVLEAGNEDPTAFRATSRYIVARAN